MPPPARAWGTYLGTTPDPTFAMVHLPSQPDRQATGVVLFPLFGWKDFCTHRARRTWANALAQAGHPTVRLDLPGTGDSAGDPRSPQRYAAFKSAACAAADWLRHEGRCSRVCAVGIGFGGLLAWVAAAEGAAIDDFVLWAVPKRGRHIVREQQAAAALSINSAIHPEALPLPEEPGLIPLAPGDLLDEAGQVTARDTLDMVAAVDLSEAVLSDAEARNFLLLQRTGIKADEDLADVIRATGARLTIANGDSYRPLMQYVRYSVVPQDVIQRSLSWLAETAALPGADPKTPTGAPTAGAIPSAHEVEFVDRGSRIRETAASFDVSGGTLCGVVTRPVDAADADLCVVFFSGGSDRRVGPNRMWVDLARRWAARGITSVRVDPPGIGDSDGDERTWLRTRSHYGAAHIDQASELLAAIGARGLPTRFVLVGFCSGGYRALQVARRDARVHGVFAIDLRFFRRTWWASTVRGSWLLSWSPGDGQSWLKVAMLRPAQKALRALQAIQLRLLPVAQHLPAYAHHVIGPLDARGTELQFILKTRSYSREQLQWGRRGARLARFHRVRADVLPGDDERFRPIALQRLVLGILEDAMTRVLLRTAPPAPQPTDGSGSGCLTSPEADLAPSLAHAVAACDRTSVSL